MVAKRSLNRLTATEVKNAPDGRHADGGGLYLAVNGTRARWLYFYTVGGKRREMGLGSAHTVPLKEARRRRDEHRATLVAGKDPLQERARLEVEAAAIAQIEAGRKSFEAARDALIGAREGGWRNAKHRQQWQNTLATYAASLDSIPCHEIKVNDVLSVLKPIWTTKPETARRVRMRIEAVLDSARVAAGDDPVWLGWTNPARLKGNLSLLLANAPAKGEGHAAMDYADLPAFMQTLRDGGTVSRRALEVLILTACRTSEVTGMRWSELDLTKAVWIIPPSRMKSARQHRVPLVARVVEVIKEMHGLHGEYVFATTRGPLSNAAMHALLQRRLGHPEVTVHGMRSAFRTWCAERTSFPRAVCERALAHVVEGDTESAYQRSDHLDQRRVLMAAWAGFLEGESNIHRLAAAS